MKRHGPREEARIAPFLNPLINRLFGKNRIPNPSCLPPIRMKNRKVAFDQRFLKASLTLGGGSG
jgi:hypothetical protein